MWSARHPIDDHCHDCQAALFLILDLFLILEKLQYLHTGLFNVHLLHGLRLTALIAYYIQRAVKLPLLKPVQGKNQ